ncbi:MAG: glycosyltransferase family 39 protein [Parcubacteria group bacterium]|nr:glycosyltransferase family 39 protein [Parcubacteria group bacterium]
MALYHSHKSLEKWFLIAVLLAAFIFRFNNLETTPPGLYPDEAINGIDALKTIDSTDYKIFYPDNNGRGGLFINFQTLFLQLFGTYPWVLRLPSAIFGLLTVLGLYLLTRLLFNWQIASIASWFLATSFWHVNFSRIGFEIILNPLLLVWGFYFLWKGLNKADIKNFIIAGFIFSLGFYTNTKFWVVILIFLLLGTAFWQRIKKDYGHDKFLHLRNEFLKGFGWLIITIIVITLPLSVYYIQNYQLFESENQSFFQSSNNLKDFGNTLIKTLGMFNFAGDQNWRHNLTGSPQLLWPVGAFFVIGLIRSIQKLFRKYKQHGHLSTIQGFLLSWFILALLPSVFSYESIPHALKTLPVIPVVMIFAAEGLWWFFETIKHWYRQVDIHPLETTSEKEHEAGILVGLVIITFIFAVGVTEYNKYFNTWAKNPNTANAFSTDLVALGKRINELPLDIQKYVIVNVNREGILVDVLDPFDPTGRTRGVPMPAQTIMFITGTYSKELQQKKNIFYLTEEQFIKQKNKIINMKNAIILPLQ